MNYAVCETWSVKPRSDGNESTYPCEGSHRHWPRAMADGDPTLLIVTIGKAGMF
jgi:hypothetical protein